MNSPFDVLLEPAEKKSTHTATVKLIDVSGPYRLGPPTRPRIEHDNGHLAMFPSREPTAADRVQLAKWIAMLEASELLCSRGSASVVPACRGEDLSDANAAYRHFLFGKGADRTLNYERFLANDPTGEKVIPNIMRELQRHAEIIGKDRTRFSITSEAFTIGTNGIAPYPETENWQKAIGGHNLWVSADLSVSANNKGEIHYTANVVIHMEDRYNFNPGQHDIATGIPDSANGTFEITGLGKQYMNYATVRRQITWREGAWSSSSPTGAPTNRQRKPNDNRRLRNRV